MYEEKIAEGWMALALVLVGTFAVIIVGSLLAMLWEIGGVIIDSIRQE